MINKKLLESYYISHPHDAAAQLSLCEPDVIESELSRLSPSQSTRVLKNFNVVTLRRIVDLLPIEHVIDYFRELSLYRISLILASLSDAQTKYLKQQLPRDLNIKIDTIHQYIDCDFLDLIHLNRGSLSSTLSLEQMQKKILSEPIIATYYITDEDSKLIGLCATQKLLRAKPSMDLHDLLEPVHISIPIQTTAQHVIHNPKWTYYSHLPVIEEDNTFLGVVTIQDVFGLLANEQKMDLLSLVTQTAEVIGESVHQLVKREKEHDNH